MGYIGNPPAERYTSIDKQTITGDGTVGPYTLTHSVGNAQEIEVFVNNVRQEPAVAYTVAADQLTMTGAVAAADDFYVVFQGKAKMTATHPSTFDLTAANGTFTGDLTVDTNTLYVDSTNNRVGIGTTSPSSALDVTGTVTADGVKVGDNQNITLGADNDMTINHGGTNASINNGTGNLSYNSDQHIFGDEFGTERMRIDSSGNVGIGDSNPKAGIKLSTYDSTWSSGNVYFNPSGNAFLLQQSNSGDDNWFGFAGNYNGTGSANIWLSANHRNTSEQSGHYIGSEASTGPNSNLTIGKVVAGSTTSTYGSKSEFARFDTSGNLLVGKTTASSADDGVLLSSSVGSYFTRDGGYAGLFNRRTSDGEIVQFRKDNTVVGLISVYGADMFIGTDDAGLTFNNSADLIAPVNPTTGATRDNAIDLGASNARFKDLYLSNAAYVNVIRGQGDIDTGMDFSGSNIVKIQTGGAERMRIDSSGNLLVGTTSTDIVDTSPADTTGCVINSSGRIDISNTGLTQILNRSGSNGDIALFRKDGTTVGSIGVNGDRIYLVNANEGIAIDDSLNELFPCNASGNVLDNTITLGGSNRRFKDLYLSGGVYLGGTGSANLLDDYEEGTFTPVLAGSGTTYTMQRGNYTKIGSLVYINFDLRINSIGSGSTNHFVGLPYSASYESAISIEALTNLATAVSYINFRISGTAVYAYYSASSTTWTTLTANPSYLGNGTVIQGSGVYITNA